MANEICVSSRAAVGRARQHLARTAFGGLIALAVIGIAASYALASARHPMATKKKPVLTIGVVPTTISTGGFDPAKESGGSGNEYSLIWAYEPILRVESNGTIGAGLATSWGYVGKGNREFAFTLAHGERFSDGTPVTASAVVKYMDYFIKAGGPFAASPNTKSIKAVGRYKVVIKFVTANNFIEWQLAATNGFGMIASPKAVANPKSMASHTDGAGPYVLSQSVQGSSYTYVPNKYYNDPSSLKFSKIVLKVISNNSTMLEALQSGQIDVAEGSIQTADQAKAAGLQVATGQTTWDGSVYLTLGAPGNPLNSQDVRQALNYALNRKAIVAAAFGKYAKPTSEWVTTDGFDPSYRNYYPYDPAKAKALLAAAGYPNGLTLTMEASAGIMPDGSNPSVESQAMAQELAAVGVKLNVTVANKNPFSGQYQMLLTWFGVNSEASYYSLFLAPNSPFLTHGWKAPTAVSSLFAKASALPPSKTESQMRALSRRITRVAYTIPLATPESLIYAKKNIGGIKFPAVDQGVYPDPTQFYVK